MPRELPYAPGQPPRMLAAVDDEMAEPMPDNEMAEGEMPEEDDGTVNGRWAAPPLSAFLAKRSNALGMPLGQPGEDIDKLAQDWLLGKRMDAPDWEKHAFNEWRHLVAGQARDELVAPRRQAQQDARRQQQMEAEGRRRQQGEETYQSHHRQQREERMQERAQREADQEHRRQIRERIKQEAMAQKERRRMERHTINGVLVR